ncbi:hypothetical protein B0H10DRAFT_2217930 [Mycena sp. CBHHK59/15]|nr:hypothetical protein B0H10DRAFT_2217930 [Mycena sp. CBHHK59/15]
MHPGASKDRPISTASAASPASSSLHPPSTGNSNSSPSPLPTSAPLSDPVSTSYPQRPSLLRSSSSAAEAADQAKRETEWRRADRAAALGLDTHRRASPRLAVDVRPGPTPRPPVPQASPTPAPTSQSPMRPQGHAAAPPPRQPNPINTSPQSPSDAPPMPRPQTQTQRHAAPPSPASPANSSFWPPPMQRPQTHAHASPLPSPLIPMTSSSQPSSHPQAMQRPQTRAHAAPLPAPTTPMGTSTHAQSLLHSHPMPRPQAHGGSVPSPTTPSHHQQQQVKPSSSSHTHKPAMYANPPSPSVALNNSTIYAAPASVSRQAPEGGQRARRPEVADAYAAVGSTRGTSKRMLSAASVAMTANTSVAGLYA